MINYYILSLAGKDYMTSLDMPISMSGILASCTPIAVTIFGFAYSQWTNCSYYWPFIYTSVMSILGNALYFSALTYQSPVMVFIGRFCTGMGGARVIARRYMADNVSVAARTRFSVTFVAVSTLGTAAGPICGGLLTLIDETEFAGFIVNKVTAPALAMLVLWLIYLVLVLVFFKEPPIPVRESVSAKESLRCKAMIPTYFCGWNLFFGKLIQESVLTTAPIVCYLFFDWDAAWVGLFMGILNLLAVPCNFIVGGVSKHVPDRVFILTSWISTTIAVALLIVYEWPM